MEPELITREKIETILNRELPFRSEVRKTLGEDAYNYYEKGKDNDYSMSNANRSIAHWSEQVLVKHFGSRDYGYTITTGQHDNSIYLDGTGSRSAPGLGSFGDEFHAEMYDLSGLPKRQYKNGVRDWVINRVIETVQEARKKIDQIEMDN